MSAKYRFLFTRRSRLAFNTTIRRSQKTVPRTNGTVPCLLGFSLFTWLGFDKKVSAEDELIKTIKHCILFIQRDDFEKAEQLLHVALRQAQQIRHELGITYIYDVMANLALEREQLEKAKTLFISVSQRIMSGGVTEDDPQIVHISAKLARISHLQKEYPTAQLGYDWCLEKLNTILSKDPSNDNKKLLALTEDWYGRLFVDNNQCEQGVQLMIKALDHMRELGEVENEHIVYQLNDIGTVYERLGKHEESINYFNQAIQLGKSLNMDDLGTMYVNIGQVYLKQSMLHEARKYCGQGWKLGAQYKNDDVKKEAESCIKQIKSLS